MVEAAFQRVPRAEIFAHTGIQFMQLNTLYQLYAMVLQNSPQLVAAETFLTIPDLLNYWLTGRKVCEFSNATTTQCFDTRRGEWSKALLQRLGIPTHIFPEVVQPGTILGELRGDVCAETGIWPIPVIAPACHDTGSAVAAVPARGGNFAWISSGTWSIMGVEAKEAVVNEMSLEASLTNEGGVNGTYRLSKNIAGLWPVQECRRTWARQGQQLSYSELTEMAAAAQPLKAVIDPDHNDFLKPGDMPARIRAYCQRTGQALPETQGEIVRTALEGVALKYRWVLERLEHLQNRRLDTIHIVGGGTQNRLLSQLAADCTGRTVITGPIEATATGNLLMQLVALGKLASIDEAREVVRRSFDVEHFEPNPATYQAWGDAYAKLNALMASA
jgi:rhamnulokinase